MRAAPASQSLVFKRRRFPRPLRKLVSSLRIAGTLILARTLGSYRHNVWNGEFEYAVYAWRGDEWAFPLEPMNTEGAVSDNNGVSS